MPHWPGQELFRQSGLLVIPGRHYLTQCEDQKSTTLSENLKSVLDTWGLVDRINGWKPVATTDNAANETLAVQMTKGLRHIWCFPHTLNLAAQKALKVEDAASTLVDVRAIVRFFFSPIS